MGKDEKVLFTHGVLTTNPERLEMLTRSLAREVVCKGEDVNHVNTCNNNIEEH